MTRRETDPGTIACDFSAAYIADDGQRVLIPATLRFDVTDPVAVIMSLRVAPDRVIEWTFARQLFADGARRSTGFGDVRIRPAFHGGQRVLAVSLSSPTGHADLELPRSRVGTFVGQTYAAVPAVKESDFIDWDAEFGKLLHPGAA
jgi:hypothetical protein